MDADERVAGQWWLAADPANHRYGQLERRGERWQLVLDRKVPATTDNHQTIQGNAMNGAPVTLLGAAWYGRSQSASMGNSNAYLNGLSVTPKK